MDKFEDVFQQVRKEHPSITRGTGRKVVFAIKDKLGDGPNLIKDRRYNSELSKTLSLLKLKGKDRVSYKALADQFFTDN